MSEPKPIDPFEMEAIAAISRSQVIQAREPELTPGRIWQTLSRVDCSKHIEKKGNLTYLSWAWALGIMMEIIQKWSSISLMMKFSKTARFW
jgi:hypothetical protein